MIGQIHQTPKVSTAYLHYLLLSEPVDESGFTVLMDRLVKEAGYWGAKQVMGEVEPETDLFRYLRQAGFSIWAKQRIFRILNPEKIKGSPDHPWQIWTNADVPAMRSLYATLVPPLIQPVEPLTRRERLGLVCYAPSGELQAYADLVYGPAGIWVLPMVHPNAGNTIQALMTQLISDLPDTAGRPVHVSIRNYQPWIEGALRRIADDESPEQALMVRHLALRQRVTAILELSPLDNGSPEPTVPIAPIRAARE